MNGIVLDDEYPGRCYRDFQQVCLRLKETGIMLALASKNDLENVWEVFDKHPGMVLKRGDISVAEVHWEPKSESIERIARRLSIGIDALVFADDSAHEISEVQSRQPAVTAIQLPEHPEFITEWLLTHLHLFDRLAVTEDDRARTSRMAEDLARDQASAALTPEEFLRSLDLRVRLFTPAPSHFSRVAQLFNKTNQFNLTTRRYALSDIERAADGLICMDVSDRFGSYGLVGIAHVCADEHAAWVDSFLMSCRVLGRGVEDALLSACMRYAAQKGYDEIWGCYSPTAKNHMVARFYSDREFEIVAEVPQSISQAFAVNSDNRFYVRKIEPGHSVPVHVHVQTCEAGTAVEHPALHQLGV